MPNRVLVVGARKGSLGDYVAKMLDALVNPAPLPPSSQWTIVTAGISGEEDIELDVTGSTSELTGVLLDVEPDHIVCTVGINRGREQSPSLAEWYREHLEANCVGPMRLLEAWLSVLPAEPYGSLGRRHFAALSSNSAHIARRASGAYCASKAALSMALRCRARELEGSPVVVYGYEPGLLRNTPMTEEVRDRLAPAREGGGEVLLTRMPGLPSGILPHTLAAMVARNLVYGGAELNGCLLRVDAGEQ